ncbi:L,D-transpeptidase family protein [Marihabitans asiaticum]|uniref:L,D-transpeptidase family protein n=1 Tax=Marihabitans asiaticum TaxID=415218 RepID=UPI001FE8D41D|nr:L,D-transpeptidase family protein [Marihabitans asiaticum]
MGTADGNYGGLTVQAVLAFQKANGLGRDGLVGPATRAALESAGRPTARGGGPADRVEIDLQRQLLLVVRGGAVQVALNTSTGSGELYETEDGEQVRATTPTGSFSVFRGVDKMDESDLGKLWRPRYFYRGWAVHGATSVPAYPASHGCARVSNPAMDMIWAKDLMPVGSAVVVL